ncbi:MAG: hypothetical protein TR69_WS6001001262 [candidate division WS6 bacterium OLB20]|uniref:Uncharacterized protein n=1 Tax=candidate division WS6 bacterium OLB20 TaxID=1617426 RepID=A0A136LWD6_9BACT|nr:MAG: hypothetical protein TR69_WS6001001262 [candidate division WS6 bacterium OLB20]
MFKLLTTATVLVLALSLVTIQLVIAQEDIEVDEYGVGETQEIIDPALKPALTIDPVQQWPDKRIRVNVTIDSQITSDRVSLDWEYPSTLFLIQGPLRDVVSVREGQVTTFTKEFVPREGLRVINSNNKRVEIGVRVNAFVQDVNYLSATNVEGTFTPDMELIPQSAEYQRSKIISTVLNWAVVIFAVSVIVILIVMGIKRFRAYLNTPDPET